MMMSTTLTKLIAEMKSDGWSVKMKRKGLK